LQRVSCSTPAGEIHLWGDAGRLAGGDDPVILALPGAYANAKGPLFRLQARFPDAVALATHLPGRNAPPLDGQSLQDYAHAYGHVVQSVLGGRPVLLVGESVGGLIALAAPNPGVGRLALDPPLTPVGLWSAREAFRRHWVRFPDAQPFVRNVLAFDGEAFGPFDHTPILGRPARVLVGSLPPTPERAMRAMPSLVGVPERELMAHHPEIHLTTVEGAGHVLTWFEDILVQVVREELDKTVRAWTQGRPRPLHPQETTGRPGTRVADSG
jgi:hypothetical protein